MQNPPASRSWNFPGWGAGGLYGFRNTDVYFLLFRFEGVPLFDGDEEFSTMLNPDLFLGFMYMFQW